MYMYIYIYIPFVNFSSTTSSLMKSLPLSTNTLSPAFATH